jgi:hypothetical protein
MKPIMNKHDNELLQRVRRILWDVGGDLVGIGELYELHTAVEQRNTTRLIRELSKAHELLDELAGIIR